MCIYTSNICPGYSSFAKKPIEVYTLPLISDEKATHFLYYLIIQRGVSLHEFSCNFSIYIRYLAIIWKFYTLNIALIWSIKRVLKSNPFYSCINKSFSNIEIEYFNIERENLFCFSQTMGKFTSNNSIEGMNLSYLLLSNTYISRKMFPKESQTTGLMEDFLQTRG